MFNLRTNSRDEPTYRFNINAFSGVDYLNSPSEIAPSRSPYALNMTNEELGSVERRLGYRDLLDHSLIPFNQKFPIRFMAHYKSATKNKIIFATTAQAAVTPVPDYYSAIYWADIVDGEIDQSTIAPAFYLLQTYFPTITNTATFEHNGKLFLILGENLPFLQVSDSGITEITPYIPNIAINCAPSGVGTPDQDINLLTKDKKRTYSTVNSTMAYTVPMAAVVDSVVLNGTPITAWDFNPTTKVLTLDNNPDAGTNNMVVSYTTTETTDNILKCTIATTYGLGDATYYFLTGNPDKPNREWYSAVEDPTYFPENNFIDIGDSAVPIMGYLKINDALAVVKQASNFDAIVHLQTAIYSDEDKKNIFPVREGVRGSGAVAKACFAHLRDEPLFLSSEGLKAIVSSAVTQTRSIQDRSMLINKILTEKDLSTATAIVYKEKLYIAIGDEVFVADSRQRTSEYGYEWQHWTGIGATAWCIVDGELWFARAEASGDAKNPYTPYICKFNSDIDGMTAYSDNGKAIPSVWTLKTLSFDDKFRKKTTSKKGCGFLMETGEKSSAVISYKADDKEWLSNDFVTLDTIYGEEDSIVPVGFNKRVRDFKNLQMRVRNDNANEKFKIHGAQITYTTGSITKGVVK